MITVCVVVTVSTSFQVSLLQRFFEHVLEVKPNIFVTYNGDSFDW